MSDELETLSARVTIKGGVGDVEILKPGTLIEVRDYDVQGSKQGLWEDENGQQCHRYFTGERTVNEDWKSGLEQLAHDIQQHAGIVTSFAPDQDPEGLNVLTIRDVGFYFYANGSGYDGWGKAE